MRVVNSRRSGVILMPIIMNQYVTARHRRPSSGLPPWEPSHNLRNPATLGRRRLVRQARGDLVHFVEPYEMISQ